MHHRTNLSAGFRLNMNKNSAIEARTGAEIRERYVQYQTESDRIQTEFRQKHIEILGFSPRVGNTLLAYLKEGIK